MRNPGRRLYRQAIIRRLGNGLAPPAIMIPESATTTYTIAEPFERAVQMVRKALAGAKMKITGELNMSGRIQRSLLIRMAPCEVLFASSATASPVTEAELPEAALSPLHVVVSGRGPQTDVHILRACSNDPVLNRVVIAMAQAIEAVGMRAGVSA